DPVAGLLPAEKLLPPPGLTDRSDLLVEFGDFEPGLLCCQVRVLLLSAGGGLHGNGDWIGLCRGRAGRIGHCRVGACGGAEAGASGVASWFRSAASGDDFTPPKSEPGRRWRCPTAGPARSS